jgi:5-methyltetrahydropteroyltriglutamate--homocysteine methyltransferase
MSRAVQTSVIGSYPVSLNTLELMQNYFSEKTTSWEQYIHQATSEMVSAGIDIVSDGQTRDPFIQLFTRRLGGCRVRDRTEIVGPVEYLGPITVLDQQYVRRLLPRNTGLLGVLTGPYTLAKSCVDVYYHDEKQLCFDFAEALRKEAEHLRKYVDVISIDEPFFSHGMPEYAKELLTIITAHLSCPTRLHACGDVSAVVAQLVELPVDILSHEFKASPHLFDAFKDYPCTKQLCIGSVRSDDARIEPVEEIVSHVRKAFDVFGENVVQLAPDCGQRLQSHDVAYQKLQHLAKAGAMIRDG